MTCVKKINISEPITFQIHSVGNSVQDSYIHSKNLVFCCMDVFVPLNPTFCFKPMFYGNFQQFQVTFFSSLVKKNNNLIFCILIFF